MNANDLVLSPQGLWFQNTRLPCTIGRGGIRADKREGDGATPVGTHRLIGMLYRPDRMARPADWALPIRPRDGWSDDPADEDYNLMITRPHPFGHERLWRADPLYDLVILTDWNWPQARKGAGSAIFLHRWRAPGKPTEGCVALAPDVLRWLAPRIRFSTRLVIRA
jgi:L,D-peptidoglycan transpeptidase YkuD (ErfK/YbiS/YcfS/YnhG family)